MIHNINVFCKSVFWMHVYFFVYLFICTFYAYILLSCRTHSHTSSLQMVYMIWFVAAIIDTVITAGWVRPKQRISDLRIFFPWWFSIDKNQWVWKIIYKHVWMGVDKYPVLFTMGWMGDEVWDFSAVKLFSDGTPHVMNEIYQGNLKKKLIGTNNPTVKLWAVYESDEQTSRTHHFVFFTESGEAERQVEHGHRVERPGGERQRLRKRAWRITKMEYIINMNKRRAQIWGCTRKTDWTDQDYAMTWRFCQS